MNMELKDFVSYTEWLFNQVQKDKDTFTICEYINETIKNADISLYDIFATNRGHYVTIGYFEKPINSINMMLIQRFFGELGWFVLFTNTKKGDMGWEYTVSINKIK